MTPKEKAKELLNKFIPFTKKWDEENGWIVDESDAQECALIAVGGIIEFIDNCDEDSDLMFSKELDYYNTVKTEINNL